MEENAKIFSSKHKILGKTISILMGLVEMYLHSGKAIGSQTLKETMFPHLSSATIRNHFSYLYDFGYLVRAHTSGGRFPTEKAIKLYANKVLSELSTSELEDILLPDEISICSNLKNRTLTRCANGNDFGAHTLLSFLEGVAQDLAMTTECAVVISLPQVEQDFVTEIRLMRLNSRRILSAIITHFGFVQSETIVLDQDFNVELVNILEKYLNDRLRSESYIVPPFEIEKMADNLYRELSIRYLMKRGRSNMDKMVRTGMSCFLKNQDLEKPNSVAGIINLFEDSHALTKILSVIQKQTNTVIFIGNDLSQFSNNANECSILGAPYFIRHLQVGAIMLLASTRVQYRKITCFLHTVQNAVTNALEKHVCRFKIDLKPFSSKKVGARHLPLVDLKKIATQNSKWRQE